MTFHSKLLITFRNLQGGQYGTLDVTARDREHIELALGSDYVWFTRNQWLVLRGVMDKFFHLSDKSEQEPGPESEKEENEELETETIVVTTGEDGQPLILEERSRSETDKRKHRRRTPRQAES